MNIKWMFAGLIMSAAVIIAIVGQIVNAAYDYDPALYNVTAILFAVFGSVIVLMRTHKEIRFGSHLRHLVELPPKGSQWQHYNGNLYEVVTIANTFSTKRNRPIMIIYKGENEKVWARPLSDWHRSMTQVYLNKNEA